MEVHLSNAQHTLPTDSSSSSSHSSTNNNNIGTPKYLPRTIDTNPYPTTFIQADTSSFKQLVQRLTGSTETAVKQSKNHHQFPPPAKPTAPKKPSFKLYERRSGLKNLKMISPLIPTHQNSCPGSRLAAGTSAFSPRTQAAILSPSLLDFPSLALSPVTPLILDLNSAAAVEAEERAIAEKGFYLHPSPGGGEQPRLLALFPVTSPRAAADSSA